MRNPDRVFLDVMTYAERIMPPPENFESQADIQRYLENIDRTSAKKNNRTRRLSALALNEMVQSDAAQQKILKNAAIQTHLKRTPLSRQKDQQRTAKPPRTFSLNEERFQQWKKNPSRFDIKGIDTKTHTSIKEFIKQKSQRWQQRKIRVYNYKNVYAFVVRKDKKNRLYAQDIITGRRVGKNIYGRFNKNISELL